MPQGWTPVDEAAPKGWTPVDETASAPAATQANAAAPQTSWMDYPKEIYQGVKRGVTNMTTGVGEAMKPQSPDEVQYGPTGRLLLHTGQAAYTGLANAYDAGKAARQSGEGWAGTALAAGKELPFVGGAVGYAEQGGPQMANPKSIGAAAEGITYAAGPKIAGDVTKAAIDLPREMLTFHRRATSLHEVTKAGAGLYQGKIQPLIQTLQGAIQNEGAKTLNQAIAADKMAGNPAISGAPVVAEVTKAMEQTGHAPTAQTQAILSRLQNSGVDPLVNQTAKTYYGTSWDNLQPKQQADLSRLLPDDLKPKAGGAAMSLEEAKNLRSDIGSAASRADRSNPKLAKVLWTAYDQLGEGMANRVKELQGTRAPYDHYNNEFRAYYELNKGVTGSMQQSLMDRHDSIPKLKEFAGADLAEVKEQMQKYGLKAQDLDKAQKDAQSLLNAHDSISGKFNKSLYRVVMGGGMPAAMALSVYGLAHGAGMYGLAPLAISALLAAKVRGLPDQIEAGNILRKLNVNPDVFQVRTAVEGPKTFDYSEPTKADLVRRARQSRGQ